MRFSIRDLLWLTLVVAVGLGWFAHQRQLQVNADAKLQKATEELQKARLERFLDKLSPAQKKFYALCMTVKKGMGEQEVDSILAGYPQKRPSIKLDDGQYLKDYDEKAGAGEGQYVFEVTFDEEHRVVSVYFNEYLK